MAYAVAIGLFIIGAFMFAAAQLHHAYHWHELHEQMNELIYNLAHVEQDVGEAEQEGG